MGWGFSRGRRWSRDDGRPPSSRSPPRAARVFLRGNAPWHAGSADSGCSPRAG
ncbi:hypothetical protein L541_4717 [Bordetella hinzii CA90 BAL1384]|nr:hypothetical protein L541_4717 [Bordetella hinzii CA90 BAL1384]